MLSPLRNRFGIPGVISVVALVFAMLGGAYAANNASDNGATASAKKKAKKGPRGPKGATGPAGPAGPAGPQGPAGAKGDNGGNGAAGDKGATGANGAAGQSVTTAAEPPFGNCGDEEGVKLTSASGTSYVCNGAEGAAGPTGEPWTAGGTLPPNATQTGTWVLGDDSPVVPPGFNVSVIPFPIPLANPLDGSHATYIGLTDGGETPLPVPAQCDDPTHPGAPSAQNPEADSGHLCVFAESFFIGVEGAEAVGVGNLQLGSGASRNGALLSKPTSTSGTVWGGFAVTG